MNYIKFLFIGLFFLLPAYVNAAVYVIEEWDLNTDGTGNAGSFSSEVLSLTGQTNYDQWKRYKNNIYPQDSNLQDSSSSGGTFADLDTAGVGGCLPDIANCLYGYYKFDAAANIFIFPFYQVNGLFYTGTYTGGTQIISVFPSTQQATGTPFSLGLNYYATEDDSSDDSIILKQKIELNTAPVLGNVWGGTGDLVASWSNAETFEYDLQLGSNIASTSYSSTQIGLRKVTTTITKQGYSLFGFEFGSDILLSTTTYFLIGTTTSGDSIDSSIQDAVNDITNTASSTVDLISIKCNPFNLNFNIPQCVLYLVIPSSGTASSLMTQAQQDIFTRFPFGYFTDAISILATTSTTTINVINATVPSNLPGGGANVTLTLNNPLYSILNATTSSYTNNSASSTDTFYNITNYYWKMLVSLLFVLYVIGRFLPFIKHK